MLSHSPTRAHIYSSIALDVSYTLAMCAWKLPTVVGATLFLEACRVAGQVRRRARKGAAPYWPYAVHTSRPASCFGWWWTWLSFQLIDVGQLATTRARSDDS